MTEFNENTDLAFNDLVSFNDTLQTILVFLKNKGIDLEIICNGSYESLGDSMAYRYLANFQYNNKPCFIDGTWAIETNEDEPNANYCNIDIDNDYVELKTLSQIFEN